MALPFYDVERDSKGNYVFYARDPHAKQLFFGWASDTRAPWLYGRGDVKTTPNKVRGHGSHNPDYGAWEWVLDKDHVSDFLRNLESGDVEKEEAAPYKELVKHLRSIGSGKGAPKKPASKENDQILYGLTFGPWADYWATEQEEKGKSFSGVDIYYSAPPAPAAAKKWGKALAKKIVDLNGVGSLTELYDWAKELGYTGDAEAFGYHLGMESVGHGVGWTDDARGLSPADRESIKLPRTDFWL